MRSESFYSCLVCIKYPRENFEEFMFFRTRVCGGGGGEQKGKKAKEVTEEYPSPGALGDTTPNGAGPEGP